MQRLFEAKKRYGLVILDYVATSNHIHILVLDDGGNACDKTWTRSIAFGSSEFVEKIKENLGWKARGRQARKVAEGYELRERLNSYIVPFRPKKSNIGPQKACFGE